MRDGLIAELRTHGATIEPGGRVADFGDAPAELSAALDAVALVDRSRLARIRGRGRDLPDLLHRLSTQDVAALPAGHGAETVLTSPKGRIVERLFVHHLGDRGLLMIAGPGRGGAVLAHLARYTFAEETGLEDATAETAALALVGPRAGEVLERLGLPRPATLGVASATLGSDVVDVLGGNGVSRDGFAVVLPAGGAPAAWAVLHAAVAAEDGRAAGERAIEAWRVIRGYGASGAELDEEHNPLEAGLRDAVSFTKGCYVGQEVVARLTTYDKVARRLLAVVVEDPDARPARGDAVLRDGIAAGVLTSVAVPPGGRRAVALAYVKRRTAGPGDTVTLRGPSGPSARLAEPPLGRADWR